MKKFIAMLTLLIGFNANAGLLTIDLSTDEVAIGDSVLVTINATGFDEADMFGFDFGFDNSVMSYDANSLSSDLALFDNGLGMFDGLEVASETFGLAFDFTTFDPALNAAGDFVLASFNLIAGSEGLTNFSVFDLAVYNNYEETDPYTIAFSGADSVNVNAVAVPEPSTVLMMMLAGFALVSSRRKAK
jgi:hypothetical protein